MGLQPTEKSLAKHPSRIATIDLREALHLFPKGEHLAPAQGCDEEATLGRDLIILEL